ncbi:hypothetical protein C6P45_005464 [Maudiozyma exigua]|uniref:Uncharacterized protein n=1 Tax=Maudiozyma exigua TaxID=34358 RepID=A0A9P7BAE1_MAUEX|nr:hypothetical protein C6P45_005464 [Kazachstania exigua]
METEQVSINNSKTSNDGLPAYQTSMVNDVEEELLSKYLPRYVFHSKFRFFWYHYSISIILTIISGIHIIVEIIIAQENSFDMKKILKRLNFESKKFFFYQVINDSPGLKISKWNVIAAKMNKYLEDEGIRDDSYTFYDGQQCLNIYNLLVSSLKPVVYRNIFTGAINRQTPNALSTEFPRVDDVNDVAIGILRNLAKKAQDVLRETLEEI